ncbi:MAG: hypothetical protein N2Z76_07110 [Treponemataceae bacterium]|nr:hypothetical protein [Treponemataceae bacterium]
MKRLGAILIIGVLTIGALSAQAFGPGPGGPGATIATQNLQITKIEGKLALVNGLIAVQTGGKTYYLRGINQLVGFIDGLKEGASVKLEGYAMQFPAAPEYYHFMVTKLTIGNKDYDLSNRPFTGMMGDGFGMGNKQGKRGRW